MGESCRIHQDCASLSCVAGACQKPTCSDGVKNADEADIDCGGSCAGCRPYKDCQVASDCAEGVCADGFCQVPTCADTVKNGDETDVDCGAACERCDKGKGCGGDADCSSGHCDGGVCVLPECTDRALNGTESDLDCGGADCSPCQAGEHCAFNTDCASLICEQKACTAYGCSDHVLNGDESATDCGGSNCEGCSELVHCNDGSDCQSGVCLSSLCVPKAPSGVVLSRDGWSAKASDTYPDDDPNEFLDSVGGRWTSGKIQYSGMWIEVDMREVRTFFSVVLTCDEQPADAPVKFDVYFSTDHKYGAPAASGQYGAAISTIKFDTARLARYVKVVLTADSPNKRWWSINELNVWK